MIHCKEALETTKNNVDEAMQILRQKGLLIADKKLSRNANEVFIFCRVDDERMKSVAVKLACETNFVAKTDYFYELC